MKNLAPIALFVYNRPIHTQKVVEALQKNSDAIHSKLYIFSDAPKNEESYEKVKQVRDYIKIITGFKSITIKEQTQNLGLAKSIIGGVTEIVNNFGKIIVLEDDIETSPFFLKFMNSALNFYEKEERVWAITGRQWPIDTSKLPEAFFLYDWPCTGWGTWASRWKFFDKNPDKYISEISLKKDIYVFNRQGTSDVYSQLTMNKTGEIDTWAIFWASEIFLNKGLSLFPAKSLIRNIGFDGSGVHCGAATITDCGDLNINEMEIDFSKIPIEENKDATELVCDFYRKQKPCILKRIIRKILGACRA